MLVHLFLLTICLPIQIVHLATEGLVSSSSYSAGAGGSNGIFVCLPIVVFAYSSQQGLVSFALLNSDVHQMIVWQQRFSPYTLTCEVFLICRILTAASTQRLLNLGLRISATMTPAALRKSSVKLQKHSSKATRHPVTSQSCRPSKVKMPPQVTIMIPLLYLTNSKICIKTFKT